MKPLTREEQIALFCLVEGHLKELKEMMGDCTDVQYFSLFDQYDQLHDIKVKLSGETNIDWTHQHIELEAYGSRSVRVIYDHQPREWPSRDHPGCEESFEICAVCWADTKQELTESELGLLQENYGPMDEYIAQYFHDKALEQACETGY